MTHAAQMAASRQEAVAENARPRADPTRDRSELRTSGASTRRSTPGHHARPRPLSFGTCGDRQASRGRRRRGSFQPLLALFFEQTEKDDLYATALTLESLNDRRAVPPLIHALLEDGNPHRRHAAARALGWIRQRAGPRRSRWLDASWIPRNPNRSARKRPSR